MREDSTHIHIDRAAKVGNDMNRLSVLPCRKHNLPEFAISIDIPMRLIVDSIHVLP